MIRPKVTVIVLFFLLSWSFISQAQIPVPTLTGNIIDQTATLTKQEKVVLEHKLRQFEAQNGTQIAVLIIPSLGKAESVEQYALRVAEKWKLGRKGIDDGVLLVIVKLDRVLRIEVGYGLEAVLTDALCNHIINKIITPQFKQNNFYNGIEDGLIKIMHTIDNIPAPQPTVKEFFKKYFILIFLACVLAIIAILAIFISLRELKNILQKTLRLNPVCALAVVIMVAFFSVYLFDSLAVIIFSIIGMVIIIRDFNEGSMYFGAGDGSSSGFRGGGGSFGGGGSSGEW